MFVFSARVLAPESGPCSRVGSLLRMSGAAAARLGSRSAPSEQRPEPGALGGTGLRRRACLGGIRGASHADSGALCPLRRFSPTQGRVRPGLREVLLTSRWDDDPQEVSRFPPDRGTAALAAWPP